MNSVLAPALAFLTLSSLANASVLIVDTTGVGDFTTIRAAIAAASEGDTILVRGGQLFDAIHIDGKSLTIMAQDPDNPPYIVKDFGDTPIFVIENLAPGQEVLLDGLRLRVDGFEYLMGAKGALTIKDCAGSVRVQNCHIEGASSMCGGGLSACNQSGAVHVLNATDVVLVACELISGVASCWKDAEGNVSCGGALKPALSVEGGAVETRLALFDSHVLGAPGRDPIDPSDFDGWNGGAAAEVSDSFVFASNTIFEGGVGSDADDGDQLNAPGNGGNGGAALVLSNAQVKELNSTLIGGAPGVGGVCIGCSPPVPPGANGIPGVTQSGCCLESISGSLRTAEIAANQLVSGKVEVTFTGAPGDVVDLLTASHGAFLYQPDRLGVLGLAAPITSLGGAGGLGLIPASGELTLLADLPPGPGTSDYQLEVQPVFTSATGQKALGPPFRILENPSCTVWIHCQSTLNSTKTQGSIGVTGTYSHGANDLVLVVRHVVPFEMGMFFYGHASTVNRTTLGDGYLCVAAPHFRLPPVEVASAFGTADRMLDLNAFPMGSGAGAVEAGRRLYFQYVYRDSLNPGGSGFNFSNGITLELCP